MFHRDERFFTLARRATGASTLLALLVTLAPVTAAQEPTSDAATHPQSSTPTDDERARLRTQLDRRLADLEAQRNRMREAIEMLDHGATPERIRAHVGDERRRVERGSGPMTGEHPMEPFDLDANPPRRGPRAGDEGPRPGGVRSDALGPRSALTDADRSRILEFLREHDPEMLERIEVFRREHPERFEQMMEARAPRILELMQERTNSPETYEIKVSLMRLEGSIHRVLRPAWGRSEGISAEEEAAVRDLLTKQAELGVKLLQVEIDQLGERVHQLERELNERSGMIERVVEDRLERLRSRIENRRSSPGSQALPRGERRERGRPR